MPETQAWIIDWNYCYVLFQNEVQGWYKIWKKSKNHNSEMNDRTKEKNPEI